MFRKRNQPRRRPIKAGDVPEAQNKRPSVFSYRASRSAASDNVGRGQSRPSENLTRPATKKRRLKRLLTVLVLLAIALVIGNNLLLQGTHPTIVIVGANNTYRNLSAYEAAAAQAFESSPFNTNKVTVNVGRIEEQLRQAFPELADVSVSLPLVGRQPTVFLEPSTSRLILRSSSGGEAFVLDETGRTVASGELVARFKEAGLPEVQDQSRISVHLGDVAIPSTSVAYITEVVRQLKAKNIEVTSLTLLETPSELHLRMKDEPYYVKLNTRGDARVAVGSFLALKTHLESQQKKPSEYIDVRVENRAYFK